MLIYTHTRSKRKPSRSKKAAAAQAAHKAFLESVGYTKPIRKLNRSWHAPDLSVEQRTAPTSDDLHHSGGFKRSVDDWKWKRGRQETDATITEIERKKTRIAPAFNKGAAQYITDGDDPKFLGRKL